MSRKPAYEVMPADNWGENLSLAILQQAAEDYREALKEDKDALPSATREHYLKRLEAFFTGDWCMMLTQSETLGTAIMQRIKKEVRTARQN